MIALARPQLPAEIERYIGRFVARRRVQRLLRAAARAALFTIVWALGWCIADRFVALSSTARSVLLGINLAVMMVILLRAAVAALLRRVDLNVAAAQIERREPRLAQRLRTITSRLTDGERYGASPELLDALARQLADEVSDRDPTRLLPWRRVIRPAAACAAWLALAWGLSFSSWLDLPTLARRYFLPNQPIRAVTTTRLSVTPGHIDITQGDPLRVQASAVRLGADRSLTLHVRARGSEAGGASERAWHAEPMTAHLDGKFEAQIARVDRDLEYYVTGGDARSDVFRVNMLPRPAVGRLRVRYVYPPHTGLAPREVETASGAIEAPVGTQATLIIEPTQPLRYVIMTIGAESIRITPPPAMPPAAAQTTLTIHNDRRYTLRMVSDRGVSGVFRGGTIRAIPDRAPVVQFSRVGDGDGANGSRQVGGGDVLPVGYQAVDDYALARLDVAVRVIRASGAEANRAVPVPLSHGAREQQGVVPLELRRFGLNAGDEIELRLQAEDLAGQFALSRPVRLSVTSSAQPSPDAATPDAPQAVVQPPAASSPNPAEAPPLDPAGYGDAIRAYFDALRRAVSPTE